MVKPVRLQLSRKKGFRLQAVSRSINGLPAVNCARPFKHRNLFRVGLVACGCRSAGECSCNTFNRETAAEAVEDFRNIPRSEKALAEIRKDLKGQNLACWCGLCDRHRAAGKPLAESCSQCPPCHCDPLGEIANR